MSVEERSIGSSRCPLCGGDNTCANQSVKKDSEVCWCSDPAIKFPKELLAKVPPEMQRKACICKACVLKFLQETGVERVGS